MKVQAESFHLSGHIIGFRPQTQKVQLPHKTLSNTLAVKRVKERIRNFKDRLLRMQTLRLRLALPRFSTYLYFILVQILDLSFGVFCFLAEKKRLLEQKNMTLFSFSSELLWVKNGKRVLKESICFLIS